MKIYSFLIASV